MKPCATGAVLDRRRSRANRATASCASTRDSDRRRKLPGAARKDNYGVREKEKEMSMVHEKFIGSSKISRGG